MGGSEKQKIVHVTDTSLYTSLPKYPLKGGGSGAKDDRCRSQAKGQLTVGICLFSPLYPNEGMILGVNGTDAICIINIHLCKLSVVPKGVHYMGSIIYERVGNMRELPLNEVIHTGIRGPGEVGYYTPFARCPLGLLVINAREVG